MIIKFNCLECSKALYFGRNLWFEKEEWASLICPNCRRKYFLNLKEPTRFSTILKYLHSHEKDSDLEVVEEKLDSERYPIKKEDTIVKIYCGLNKWDNELIGIANLTRDWQYQKSVRELSEVVIFNRRNVLPTALKYSIIAGLFYYFLYLGNSTILPNKKFDPIPVRSIIVATSLHLGFRFYRSERQKDRKKKLTGLKLKQIELSEIYQFQEKIEQLLIENKQLNEKSDRLRINLKKMKRVDKNIYSSVEAKLQQKRKVLSELQQNNKKLIGEYKQLIKMLEIQSSLNQLEQNEGIELIKLEQKKEALSEALLRKEELILLADPQKLIE